LHNGKVFQMNVNRILTTLLAGAALTTSASLAAQTQNPPPPKATGLVATAPGKAVVAHSTEMTATVVGVDPGKRTVSLKRANGNVSTIDVGDEVKNFDQIKVGDIVRAKYTMALALELKKGPVTQGPPTEEQAITPAPAAGAKPGGAVGRKVTVIADVTAVDTSKHVVTLRGPRGNELDLDVQDPEQLKNIQKGDHVQVTYVEALAISVAPATPAATSK
jgi:hypothetical protein